MLEHFPGNGDVHVRLVGFDKPILVVCEYIFATSNDLRGVTP